MGQSIHINIQNDQLFGIVSKTPNSEAPGLSLTYSITIASSISQHMLLTIGDKPVALIHDHNNNYFLVDPHARIYNGLPRDTATTLVLSFNSASHLANHLIALNTGQQFNLTHVLFSMQNCNHINPIAPGTNQMYPGSDPPSYHSLVSEPRHEYCGISTPQISLTRIIQKDHI